MIKKNTYSLLAIEEKALTYREMMYTLFHKTTIFL